MQLLAQDETSPSFARLPAALENGRGFGREIYSGVLRHKARLDWTLQPLLKKPLEKLDAPVRAALRMALYEKLCLKTPQSALGNEYAGLMRVFRLTSATGFVNAVVRKLPDQWRPAAANVTAAERLALEESHPLWLVERWLARLGPEECRALLQANNTPAALALRVNTLKSTRPEALALLQKQAIAAQAGKLSPDALILGEGGDPTRLPKWDEGWFIVQDEAAQLPARLAAPASGSLVIDMAAAPGGKSTHLAQLMGNRGRIWALDIAPGRLKLIRENARRLGITIIETEEQDGRDLAGKLKEQVQAQGGADLVLLDAPCLGTGTLRRRPDAKWRKTPRDLSDLVALQKELLETAGQLVKPNGTLLYSTCSLEPEENQDQIQGFLQRHPQWQLSPAGPEFAGVATAQGYLESWPHHHGTDGMFAARLIKTA
jgi:16S rRNA (cytosine967-C5)-methyltransferase